MKRGSGKKQGKDTGKGAGASERQTLDERDEHDEDALEGEIVDASSAERDPAEGEEGEAVEADAVEAEVVDDPGELEPRDEELDADVEVGDDVIDIGAAPVRAALARPASDAVATQDPLQAYMRDVQRYSLLTPEETHALAVRYLETGDVDAAKKLVTSNLRLVVKIAYDYRRAYRNILDLIQEGNIGLMQAVKKYDPYRGVKLSSYSAWWIRAYILRFILNNWRLVKLGTTQAQRKLFFNLKKERARLSAMGIEPTPELIAERLSVPAAEVVHMERRLSSGDVSLDAPLGQGTDGRATTRLDMLTDANDGPVDERLAQGEVNDLLQEKIREFGRTLKGKEEIIFRERLMADEPKTLQELGDQFGVSRERVRQLEKRLTGKIRVYLEQNVERGALPD